MAEKRISPAAVMRKCVDAGDVDLPREMLKLIAEMLMSAEADAVCGAEYGEVSDERVNRRNGYRPREWDTRMGTVELAIPKLRQGSYFPEWLLMPRRRAERAMTQVVVEAYVLGVSTRRVDKLVQTMGMEGISKSQVSRLAGQIAGLTLGRATR